MATVYLHSIFDFYYFSQFISSDTFAPTAIKIKYSYIIYNMPSKRNRTNNKRYKRMRGGSGAADYATQVFGGPGSQTAGSDGHTIAMSAPSCQSGGSASVKISGGGVADNAGLVDVAIKATPVMVKGGNAVSDGTGAPAQSGVIKGGRRGGSGMTEIAVPAVLLTLNQLNKRRRTSKKNGGKSKKSRRNRK